MTKRGETDGFSSKDFVKNIECYLGENVLYAAVFNKTKPAQKILARYKKEGAIFIAPPRERLNNQKPSVIVADLLDDGMLIRHNQKQLAKALLSII